MTRTLNANIPGASPETLFPVFAKLAEALEVDCVQGGESFSMALSGGEIRLAARPGAVALTLSAENERRLYLLQQIALNRLDSLDPVPQPEWEKLDVGALPPNLGVATVASVARISPNFNRVRVVCPDLERYVADGLHFRLVISALPPERAQGGSVTRWPTIGPSGRTLWPEGEAELHRPVYTLREIDPAGAWMDFDVYLHEGGRVSAWTERAAPGDRIGLMGPTTRNPISAAWVGFWGDETAIPAIARHCAALPETARGRIRIALGDLADRQDFAHPPGLELVWIPRGPLSLLEDLRAAAASGEIPAEDSFAFFASEDSETDLARRLLREDLGFDKKTSSVIGYWRAEAAPEAASA